ncbi:MAG: hypothetical protein AAGA73_11595 [Pseudomonadota bacterium]
MLVVRLSVGVIAIALMSAPAFAKTDTLAEHAKKLCEEAGVPLEDCKGLHPSLRTTAVAVAKPAPKPEPSRGVGLGLAAFGTGKYGWCEDCTSLLAAAPITPWENFAGRQRQPNRDEDDRNFADAGNAAGGPDQDNGVDDAGTDNGNGDDDTGDDGDPGDSDTGSGDGGGGGDAGDGGEICD